MFCEYIFEGTGRKNDLDSAPAQQIGIVEPPLVNPVKVDRTFDNNGAVTATQMKLFNSEATTRVPGEFRYAFEEEFRWKSAEPPHALYWESELNAMAWVEHLAHSTNTSFERTNEVRRRIRFMHPSANAGVRLNRAVVWARSTRWGQSQNIPERVISMTGPPDWFRATEMFTNRIVPHIEIVRGQPIYDNTPELKEVTGNHTYQGLGSILYSNVELNTWDWSAKIGLKVTALNWSTDDPAATFSYGVETDISRTTPVVMPAKVGPPQTRPRLRWTGKRFSDGDLVHRGCAFLKGQNGTAWCDYLKQNAARYISLHEEVHPVQPNLVPQEFYLTRPILLAEENIDIAFSLTSDPNTFLRFTGTSLPKLIADPDNPGLFQDRAVRVVHRLHLRLDSHPHRAQSPAAPQRGFLRPLRCDGGGPKGRLRGRVPQCRRCAMPVLCRTGSADRRPIRSRRFQRCRVGEHGERSAANPGLARDPAGRNDEDRPTAVS